MGLHSKKQIKQAFTMAEAILVMTILGIIATIMITTLKPAEFKEKGLKVSAKKVLSEIDTATTQILVNNTKLGSFNSLVHDNGTNFTWKGNGATVLEYYKKYLTTIRTIVPSTSFCITGDSSRNAKAVYLKDGACIGIYDSETTNAQTIFPGETTTKQSNASQGLLLFDTNGEEEPNTIGVDRFILPIDSSGIAYDAIADAGGGASPEPEPEAPSGGPYPCTSEGYDALCKSEFGSEAYYDGSYGGLCGYPTLSSDPICEGEFDFQEVTCRNNEAQLGSAGEVCW